MSPHYLIECRIEFDAGHRITHHGSKCRNLHGHRYTVVAVCSGPLITTGEQQGMVIDFDFLREEMNKTIMECCDHTMMLWIDDPLAQNFIDDPKRFENEIRPEVAKNGGYRTDQSLVGALYFMSAVPTAENLAAHWFEKLHPKVRERSGHQAQLHQIKVYETPEFIAVYPAYS